MLADPVVRLLLGGQWEAAAPLVRIMALGSMTLFPAFITYPVLVAVGAIRDALVSSLISIPPSLLLIYLASLHNLEAVAATQLVTGPLQVYVALRFIRRHVPITWGEFCASVVPSGVIALFAAAPTVIAVLLAGFRFDLSLPVTVASCIGAAAAWLAGLWVTQHPLLAEIQRVALRSGWNNFRPAWLRS
jgi:O-antigen/teichoic acid export membrane protein